MNTVALTGRLTHAPELKSTATGMSVLRFAIAVDRNYQAKDKERQADFIDCLAWKTTAEFIARNFRKGQMIALTGELQTSTYEKDGQKRKSVEVVVSQVSFCGDKPKEQATPGTTNFEEIEDDGKMPWEE